MSRSKEIILNRIQDALGKKTEQTEANVSRDYRQKSGLDADQIMQMFAERVNEYNAVTEQVSEKEIPNRLKQICEDASIEKLVIPAGIDESWLDGLPASVRILRDEPNLLPKEQLNESDAVLTGCYLGVAQTGSIILNAGAGQGRRILTLLPDFHICVIRAEQIVGIMPEAIRILDQTVKESGAPVTFISGPSATSDIELNRVEGVHGPRKLHVFILN